MIVPKRGGSEHPSDILRTMAVYAVTDGEAERLVALADALEQQFGRQNGQFQVALGTTDLDLRDAFAEEISLLRTDLMTRLDTLDERHRTMLEFLEELQEHVRGLQGGSPS